MEYEKIQEIYSKVCAGYDEIFIEGASCYFKHSKYEDRIKLKHKFNEGLEKAKDKGVKTESDYLEFFIKKGWWSKDKEDEIRTLEHFVESLKKSKEKLLLPSQKQQMQKNIEEEYAKLYKIKQERKSIIPITAEEYAEKYYNRYYLSNLLFRDPLLTLPFSDSEEYFNEIDEDLYNFIWRQVIDKLNDLKIDNLKYIAATGFFQNLLMLCGEGFSAYMFYGKSITSLTINQIDLFSFGASYRRSINNSTEKIPDYILSDPNELISWCEGGSSGRAKKMLDKTPNKNKTKGERSGRMSSIVGANASDYKALGIGGLADDKTNLVNAAEKEGGEMGIYQAIKKTDSLVKNKK